MDSPKAEWDTLEKSGQVAHDKGADAEAKFREVFQRRYVSDYLALIAERPACRKAMSKLVNAGADPDVVAREMVGSAGYLDFLDSRMRSPKRGTPQHSRRTLPGRIRDLAEEIESLNKDGAFWVGGVGVLGVPPWLGFDLLPPMAEYIGFPGQLRRYAEMIENRAQSIRKAPGRHSKPTRHNREAVRLAWLIKSATGGFHYRESALLMSAARGLYRLPKIPAGTLRRLVHKSRAK